MEKKAVALGARLRALRVKRRESLQQVADAIGASKAHVWELETGRSKNPSVDLLTRLAQHFEVGVAHLVGEDEAAEEMKMHMFGREFEGLNEEDWDILRGMAKRLKSTGNKEPPDGS